MSQDTHFYNYCFTNKEIIGNGAYGAVFTTDVPFASKNGEANATVEKVVVKKMLSDDVLDKKTFIKEARILQRLKHPNIVDFKGICNNPFALVLEYVYFDFKPFGVEQKVSSLAQFLGVLEGFAECHGFDSPHVISTICKDMAAGLQYLHQNGVTHRDFKPANILISNQHYCDLAIDDIEEAWERRPLVCKVADFGESRSSEIQTNSILQSKTNRVNRSTPVYMAPEMLVEEMRLPVASTEDLKRADIWSFGMTLFVLLNRSIRYPYYGEIQEALKEGKVPIRTLENLFKNRKVPIQPSKHQHKHATDWFFVHKIWAKCIQFDPTARPTIEDVVKMINQDSAADPATSALNIHLKVSQRNFEL